MTFDPVALLRLLAAHGVRYVLIGGQAARLLGSPLMSLDLDICYDRAPDNLDALAAALRECEARLRGVDEDVPFLLDARTLRNGDSFTFETRYGPLDVLATPSGTRGYPDLAPAARPMDVGGVSVPVVALNDLIRMKTAAGRVKDRLAVEELLALRDERREER
ncbi:MAG TPA: hypothetical protein VGX28_16490 [Frankiaceae bacterium]|nr:hypothetical protein [Frankiaceae bacterium]